MYWDIGEKQLNSIGYFGLISSPLIKFSLLTK